MTETDFRFADQEFDPAIPIDSIREHPANPNEADVDLIADSLDRFGFIGAIVVHKSTGNILSGNHRYRTAKAKGAPAIPGFWLDVDDETAGQWMVTDNDSARRGEWAEARLLALLEPMTTLPPGYTPSRVEDLRTLLNPPREQAQVAPLEEVQMIPVKGVKPYWRNPRQVNDKAVGQTAESIREFGWQQPIVTDPDMVIIVGHTRYRAALHLGLEEIPVVVTRRLTAAQAKAYRIADNRTSDYGVWKFGDLALELNGLDEEFSKVLDLADWAGIIKNFEDAQDEALKLGEDVPASLGVGFSLTVIFESREAADRAGPALMELPGVLYVRYAHTGSRGNPPSGDLGGPPGAD